MPYPRNESNSPADPLMYVRARLDVELRDVELIARLERAAEATARVRRGGLVARELVWDVIGARVKHRPTLSTGQVAADRVKPRLRCNAAGVIAAGVDTSRDGQVDAAAECVTAVTASGGERLHRRGRDDGAW